MSIKRLFEHTTKFWEITLEDGSDTTVVRFGKLGTGGQTRDKKHASIDEAKKFVEKMIKEKLKEGYVEAGEGGAGRAAGESSEKSAAGTAEDEGEEETKEEEQEEEAKPKRGRAKAAAPAEPAAKKARATKSKKAAEPEEKKEEEKAEESSAPNRSQALHMLLSTFDFSDLTAEKDRRVSVVDAFVGDNNAFIYWDEAEGKDIFTPALKAWSFGVVYSPKQFGWLQELQVKEKAGEPVSSPEGYTEADLESLQRDLAHLSVTASMIKPCTAALGSETDYPFLPIVLLTESLEPKPLFTALGLHENALKRVQPTDLSNKSAEELEAWYDDRILSKESYDEGSEDFTTKKEEWKGLWEAIEWWKRNGMACAIAGESACNPVPVVIAGWSDEKGSEGKPKRATGVFSGVVYT